jgi:hypothetical protein
MEITWKRRTRLLCTIQHTFRRMAVALKARCFAGNLGTDSEFLLTF